jgi:ketosteroid isomerase-like protein
MSPDNSAVVRGIYDAFGRGDMPAVLAMLDPKIEWREADNFIYADGSPYVGPNAVLAGVLMRFGTEWDGFTLALEEILAAGETVIGKGYYSGAYKKTGTKVRAQFAHFFTIHEGKVRKFQQFTDTAQFQRAVGNL